jgi:hypothetical protein
VKQKFLGVGDTVITKQQISSNGRGNTQSLNQVFYRIGGGIDTMIFSAKYTKRDTLKTAIHIRQRMTKSGQFIS